MKYLSSVGAAFAIYGVLATTLGMAQANGDTEDKSPPAVNPGRPTITDPASLTAPGWLETEFGLTKGLNRDRSFSTPTLLKLTDRNRRLQYRLGFDGYLKPGQGASGFGDTYAGLHYLFTNQQQSKFDIAGRITVKIPTARVAIGGTQKVDFNAQLLASRDFTPSIHADFNLGFSSLTQPDPGAPALGSNGFAPGVDYQYQATASFTFPLKGGRWAYTNELVYSSGTSQADYSVTTMHGFTYSVHRYDVYDIAVQWQLHGDGANFQILAGKTFFLGKLF